MVSEARSERRGVRWRSRSCGGAVDRRGGEEATDRWGPGVSGGEREKTPQTEGVKSRRKRISHNTPTTRGPSGCEASGPGRGRRLGPAGRPRPGVVVAGPAEG